MFKKLIKKFKDMQEKEVKEIQEKNQKKRELKAKETERQTIIAAKQKIATSPQKTKRNPNPYKEFKTVMEMVYVMQKAHYAKRNWSKAQKDEFEKKFSENYEKCQRNPQFQKDYMDYAEASEQGIIKNPKNQREVQLNGILEEVNAIDLACQPLQLDRPSIIKKQRAVRFKYEQRLDANKRDKDLGIEIVSTKRHIIRI